MGMNSRLSAVLKSSLLAVGLIATVGANAAPASAADDNIRFTMRKGDNLFTLAEAYFLKLGDYKTVQRLNKIADPLRIPVGTVIAIPRSVLKYKEGRAKLLSVRGNVSVGAALAKAGQVLSEGSTIVTSGNSFVTLVLDDGSRVSLPSNSTVGISRLRTYVLGGSIDYDLDVKKGGAHSRVEKLKSSDDRYRVGTPRAVSAVRGTEFQSRYDAANNKDFTEVVEGLVAVDAGSASQHVPAGNALLVRADGTAVAEAMAPKPALANPGRVQADPEIQFSIDNAAPDAQYVLALANDAGFTDQIDEVMAPAGNARFANIPNGRYFVRARQVSPSGVEGQPATYGFKRRLNGIDASVVNGADGYNFKWNGEGDGVRRFHFQLFRESNASPFIDEAALTAGQVVISDLPPGEYSWRVGSVQYLDGEVATNWTKLEKLTIAAN